MKLPVRWTPESTSDVIGIWEYIAADNFLAADRMIDRIDAVLELLAESPNMGREHSPLGVGVRGLPVGRYIVFYRLVDNVIQVLRVLHGARDVETQFGESPPGPD